MLYVVALQDIPDNADIRTSLLDAHMAHIGQYLDRIRLGGPLLHDAEDRVAGGILILEAESADEVMEIVRADPYFEAGLWEDVRIHAFKAIINGWHDDAADD